jgi:hypothetical protein
MKARRHLLHRKRKNSEIATTRHRKIADLSPAEFDELFVFFRRLFTDLKRDWESRPENQGKKVNYTALWNDYAAASKRLKKQTEKKK